MKRRGTAKIKGSIQTAVEKTFGDMAFIDVAPSPDSSRDVMYSHLIHISFDKPEAGQISLFLPYECKKMIVENIYGENWKNMKPVHIDDCLLEILNVLTGSFLSSYYGKKVKYDLAFPEILFDDKEIEEKEKSHYFLFDAEGIVFQVSVSFSE